jgi:hypothetical protein
MAETRFEWTLDGEDAGSTPWEFDSISSPSSTFALDSTNPNHGTYAYRFTSDASEGEAYGQYAWTNTDKNEYWVRTYLYIDPDMSLAAGYSANYFMGGFDGGTYLFRIGFRSGGAGPPTEWYCAYKYSGSSSNTNFATGTWLRVEVKFVTSGTVGGYALYVDGDLVISDLDQDTSGEYWDTMRLGLYDNNRQSDGDYIDFDDNVGDTSQPGVYSDDAGGISGTSADGTSYGDSVIALMTAYPEVTEGSTFADTPITSATFYVSVSEGISLSDIAALVSGALGTAVENIQFGDATSAAMRFSPVSADGATFADTPIAVATFSATVAEGITLADLTTAIETMLAEVTEGTTFADVTAEVGALATGIITITVTSSSGTATVTATAAGIATTVSTPNITVS